MRRVITMGSGGQDLRDLNVCSRDDPDTGIVTFTGDRIPRIADSVHPAPLADVLSPDLTRRSAR